MPAASLILNRNYPNFLGTLLAEVIQLNNAGLAFNFRGLVDAATTLTGMINLQFCQPPDIIFIDIVPYSVR
jgi:hypothetical protein